MNLRFCWLTICLLVSPVATAEENKCDRYAPFLAGTLNGFEHLRGTDVSSAVGAAESQTVYLASRPVDGFEQCLIANGYRQDGSGSMFSCERATADEALAWQAYEDELQQLEFCFAAFTEVPPIDEAPEASFPILATQHFAAEVETGSIRLRVRAGVGLRSISLDSVSTFALSVMFSSDRVGLTSETSGT